MSTRKIFPATIANERVLVIVPRHLSMISDKIFCLEETLNVRVLIEDGCVVWLRACHQMLFASPLLYAPSFEVEKALLLP
jgi:hypothetical protein